MSTPMSSLQKTKKPPFPNYVPFRNTASNVLETDLESKLLNEVTDKMASTQLRKFKGSPGGGMYQSQVMTGRGEGNGRGSKEQNSKSAPSDHDLMMLMTQRIKDLETRLNFQSKETASKDSKIKFLEDRVKILERSQESGNSEKAIKLLERKCFLLQQQVEEMEGFLADYGMIWVGEKDDVNDEDDFDPNDYDNAISSRSSVWKPAASMATETDEFSVDFELFAKNINELSILAGDGIAKIHHTPDGARLKMPNTVQLTIYDNGIFMFNGPFRPFTESSTRQLVQDILDGYFPSELQSRYPDGIPFKFTDKRNVHFKDKRSDVFQGEGQVLGGENTSSCLIPRTAMRSRKTETNNEESSLPGPKLTMDQFLKNLPSSIIKNGKIIDVRNSIRDKFQTSSNEPSAATTVTVADTPALREIKERLEMSETERPPSSRHVTTLRIKSESGDHTYILKMRFSDTIGDVRKYLNNERSSYEKNMDYNIMSSFPVRVYNEDNATLYDLGLTPNATLHLQKKK